MNLFASDDVKRDSTLFFKFSQKWNHKYIAVQVTNSWHNHASGTCMFCMD